MRIGIALLVVTVCSGCVAPASRTLTVTTQVRGMELRDLQAHPGTAECGCTYSVNW